MHFADLAACSYFGAEAAPKLRAVGWLEAARPFPRGPLAAEDLAALEALARDPWQPVAYLGWHDCDLCPRTARACAPKHGNLFVPAVGFLYAAPELLLHYVQAHGYAPPREFLDAARTCPDGQSAAYVARVRAAGPAVIGGWPLARWTELGAAEPELERAMIEADPGRRRLAVRAAFEGACRAVGLDDPALLRALDALGSGDEALEEAVWDLAGPLGKDRARRAPYEVARALAWAVRRESLVRSCRAIEVAREACGAGWPAARPAVLTPLV